VDEPVELDRLPLAARKMLNLGAEGRDFGAGAGHRPRDHLLHLALLQDGHAEIVLHNLTAHEEIGDHVDIGAEREVLVDRLDAGCLGFGGCLCGEFAALEQHGARGRLQPAGDDLDQCRFACAVVAEQRHHFAAADRKADAAQRFDGAEVLPDILELEQLLLGAHAARAFLAAAPCQAQRLAGGELASQWNC
jgi:hypothetical protein